MQDNLDIFFKQSRDSLVDQDYQCAFLNCKKCEIVSTALYNQSTQIERLHVIDTLFEVYLLTLECHKKACCIECAQREIQNYFDYFLEIHINQLNYHQLRIKASVYLKAVFFDLRNIYRDQKKYFQIAKLENIFSENYKPLILI